MPTNWIHLEQALAAIFATRLFDETFEVGARDELEYLAEHAA
jgi:hypothetical protein